MSFRGKLESARKRPLTLNADSRQIVDGRVSLEALPISIVVPTYRRESILIDTIRHLLDLEPNAAEILVLDQTEKHQEIVESTLRDWEIAGAIKLIRLAEPSIPRAMNRGLCEAGQDFVMFVDDDVVPVPSLLQKYLYALEKTGAALIAGRVVQPWQEGNDFSEVKGFHFASMERRWTREFMGCNFTVRRKLALGLGGFDEQFVRVAYNFEAEFAYRVIQAGYRIFYEPAACIQHLKVRGGGTRAFGDHLKSYRPNHAVGAYYFILRTWSGWQSLFRFLGRPVGAIAKRHFLRRPWWIPAMLVAEFSGMAWAIMLAAQGPRYLSCRNLTKGVRLQ
jgi:GT2 family glycosyltransferase